jgi:hypothetical protein
MKKTEVIQYINKINNLNLSSADTFFSSVNKSKSVWWLNIKTTKFKNEVNLLLNANDKIIWVFLPKNFVNKLDSNFKIRLDKKAVDLEISSDINNNYLIDIKSGGTKFNFSKYIKEVIQY